MAREQFTFYHGLRLCKKSIALPEALRRMFIAYEHVTPDLAGATA